MYIHTQRSIQSIQIHEYITLYLLLYVRLIIIAIVEKDLHIKYSSVYMCSNVRVYVYIDVN